MKRKENLEKRSKFSFQKEELEKARAILEEYREKSEMLYEKVLQAERKEFLEWKGSMLYGEIDLLALQGQQWKIIDFKTGTENPMYIEQLVLYQELLKNIRKGKTFCYLFIIFWNREKKNRAFFGRTGKDFGQNTVHDSKNSKERLSKKRIPRRNL